MSGKGYEAIRRHCKRPSDKRGRPAAAPLVIDTLMAQAVHDFLLHVQARHLTEGTVKTKCANLVVFLAWCRERDLRDPAAITKSMLEAYARALGRRRTAKDRPLSYITRRMHLLAVRDLFRWLCRENLIPANPASELELPRKEHRLPEEPLSAEQVGALFAVPDLGDPLGVRDRAMLELFYATGIRRAELTRLQVQDFNRDRLTLQVRQGKGRKDRVVPVGRRAGEWLVRYLDEVRPRLLVREEEPALFLSGYGDAFNADFVSHQIKRMYAQAGLKVKGACHLLRHTCATHMLENGADIRFIQQLLGHANLETTQIYTEVSIRQLIEVHARTHPSASGKK